MNAENSLLDKEKKFFLQILADYLNERTTAVPDNLNWHVLVKIGQDQQLDGIVYHQCKNSIAQADLPMETKMKWKQVYVYNFFWNLKRRALLNQIDAEFQKESIPYLIFKGTEVAKFYPVPAQRTMNDSDFLVRAEDKQRACNALVKLGFNMNPNLSNEWTGIKEELEIELHHRLIYDLNIELPSIRNWGDEVWIHAIKQGNQVQHKLDITYHMVYTLLHLRKHLLIEGVGFRQFMDVAVLASQPDINWLQAESWLDELSLKKFSQVCFAFCKRWFDVQIPISKFELGEEFYSFFTQKMLSGGVFGLKNKETTENIVFNEKRFAKSSSLYGILRHAFLPYQVMRVLPYCGFLDGRPWLLPVAWCWRFMYRIGKLVPLLKGAYGNETIKKKEDELSNWGL